MKRKRREQLAKCNGRIAYAVALAVTVAYIVHGVRAGRR